MPYAPDLNLLFVHIPKNAGTTIELLLNTNTPKEARSYRWRTPMNRLLTLGQRLTSDKKVAKRLWGTLDISLSAQHLTLQEIVLLNLIPGHAQDKVSVLAVCRNPFTRAVSLFLHLTHKKKVACTPTNFENFLTQFMTSSPTGVSHNLIAFKRTQLAFMRAPNGSLGVQHLVRFENLAVDLQRLQAEGVIPQGDIPTANRASRGIEAGLIYTPKARQLVEDYYREDLETFNYEFPG